MDAEDLALFTRSVRAAFTSDAIDAALDEMGWIDAFRADQRSAVAVLFDEQGRVCASSNSLELLLHEMDAVPHARRVSGMDPNARLLEVGDLGDAALRLVRLALGHELVGASRAMLELARNHALERIQFGVPIASFQAVRHRLAETLVAIETAEAALDAAWIDDASHHTAIAKALAGRGARITAKHCQQVLAGIGFTMEHPFHNYLRRVLVLDEQFGSARLLTTELGERILASGELPGALAL